MTTDAPDRIALTGLQVRAHHGVFARERREGQPFVVDVVLRLDTGPAADGDDLSRTVDYGEVAQRVHDVVASDPVDLIETVAARVADTCLEFEGVASVLVTVHKPEAPIAVTFSDVAVTIERSRHD
ncbi:MAG: dihydroneopterin aldolase [Nocardioidaceae bacterium]